MLPPVVECPKRARRVLHGRGASAHKPLNNKCTAGGAALRSRLFTRTIKDSTELASMRRAHSFTR